MRAVCFYSMLLLLSSCSEAGIQGPSSHEATDQYDLDAPTLDDTPYVAEDTGPDSDQPACDEECQYQKDCWKCSYYFCPPLDAIWQQELCFDRCVEPPVLISESECIEYLECDPSQYVIGQEPCTTDDGYPGYATIYCNKGHEQTGECVTECVPEACDGEDNDCDEVVDEGFSEIVEVCNGLDDNCNGVVDEGITGECEDDCGPGTISCIAGEEVCVGTDPEEEFCNGLDDDCDGYIDEGQLNACGTCGDVPDEVCNGVDDDCNGDTDEDLIAGCSTVCEAGYQLCLGGQWTPCSAQPPLDEICNAFDDDCDGQIDEGLDCQCPPSFVGALIPCMEPPLLCGQGYKTCECVDPSCQATTMTQCFAVCYWLPPSEDPCDPFSGVPVPEMCNDFDDDCDAAIDEDLSAQCYSGDESTLGVGICHAGELICEAGTWGNYPANSGVFVDEYCLDEQLPLEEDLCSGQDDNCDGVLDKDIEDTDILFIVDTSGSMSHIINAVQQAMSMFSAYYSDEEVIQWGLIIGPVDSGYQEMLQFDTNLAPFPQFLPHLATISASYSTGKEMLYDAVYLSIMNLVNPSLLTTIPQAWVSSVVSSPPLSSFSPSWREDAHHVIVVFTDEPGQSYLIPEVDKALIAQTAAAADDLSIYTFSAFGGKSDWADISIGGSWFPLTSNPAEMFDALMQVLDETACSGGSP